VKTSYFAKYKEGERGVSIATGSPAWFKGRTYPPLNPGWVLAKSFQNNQDEEYFTKMYHELVLDKLDPKKVFDDLRGCTLLCWEKSGEFCHRRVVARWLEEALGVTINEL